MMGTNLVLPRGVESMMELKDEGTEPTSQRFSAPNQKTIAQLSAWDFMCVFHTEGIRCYRGVVSGIQKHVPSAILKTSLHGVPTARRSPANFKCSYFTSMTIWKLSSCLQNQGIHLARVPSHHTKAEACPQTRHLFSLDWGCFNT